jgi:hypothetical protein
MVLDVDPIPPLPHHVRVVWREVCQSILHVREVVGDIVLLLDEVIFFFLAPIISNVLDLDSFHVRNLPWDRQFLGTYFQPFYTSTAIAGSVDALLFVKVYSQDWQSFMVVCLPVSSRAHQTFAHCVGISDVVALTGRPYGRRGTAMGLPICLAPQIKAFTKVLPFKMPPAKTQVPSFSFNEVRHQKFHLFANPTAMLLTALLRALREPFAGFAIKVHVVRAKPFLPRGLHDFLYLVHFHLYIMDDVRLAPALSELRVVYIIRHALPLAGATFVLPHGLNVVRPFHRPMKPM